MVGFSKYVIFKNIQILKIRKNKHKKENRKQKKMAVGPVQTDNAHREELPA
jgi:hypothetical protein